MTGIDINNSAGIQPETPSLEELQTPVSIGGTSEEEMIQLQNDVGEWLQSNEGQLAMDRAGRDSRTESERLLSARDVPPQLMHAEVNFTAL